MPRRRQKARKRSSGSRLGWVLVLGSVGAAGYLLLRRAAAIGAAIDREYPLQARLSAYWPATNELERPREGPDVNREEGPLYSLQDYLAGKAPYVSVAGDFASFPKFGEQIQILELEELYGRPLLFRVTDSLRADDTRKGKGTGTTRLDIRVATREEGYSPNLNQWVHYRRPNPPPGAKVSDEVSANG